MIAVRLYTIYWNLHSVINHVTLFSLVVVAGILIIADLMAYGLTWNSMYSNHMEIERATVQLNITICAPNYFDCIGITDIAYNFPAFSRLLFRSLLVLFSSIFVHFISDFVTFVIVWLYFLNRSFCVINIPHTNTTVSHFCDSCYRFS